MSARRNRGRDTLALRRDALIRECALQRLTLVAEARNLLAPLEPDHLRATFGTRLRIVLMIGGAALGLLLARSRRAMPMLLAATSLWRSARSVLPLVRRIAGHVKK